MKRIIVACGSVIATSTIISSHLSELLDAHHVRYELIQCSLQEIESYVSDADLIVTSMDLQKKYPIPKVTAISFLTSVGAENTEEEILNILK